MQGQVDGKGVLENEDRVGKVGQPLYLWPERPSLSPVEVQMRPAVAPAVARFKSGLKSYASSVRFI